MGKGAEASRERERTCSWAGFELFNLHLHRPLLALAQWWTAPSANLERRKFLLQGLLLLFKLDERKLEVVLQVCPVSAR